MRFGVNARRLAGQRLGVARYIEYLLRYWAEQTRPDEQGVLYLREPLGEADRTLIERYETRVLPPRPDGILWENLRLPRAAADVDVLFAPGYTSPLAYSGKTVVAIHSMNEVERGTHPWWYGVTYSPIYRLSALRATRVIVPSESTKGDILRHYGLEEKKVVVVPQGADETFRPLADDDLVHRTRRRWLGEDRPYILFVGKLSQRRNVPALIRAFARARAAHDLPHALLLLGPDHLNLGLRELSEELGVGPDVVQNDGKVGSHEELVAAYNAADLYVNASLYEGFSLTLVEALSCGTPVVATKRGALGEIAGDAAVLVDEPSPEELAVAIGRVLTDPALQSDLRERGPRRADGFRWRDTAQRTLDVLREVAAA
jgi:glycosyltransferase involved in cell wall biosynthesis